ncbi:histidine kinase [Phreatobacter stygius]|uniref:Histidine kinase n=1 Tax=Phreatobacter stygius TaxID=1940610 RepID=A0A4D7AUT7_9HYPH|nr:histidine kinase [Phreatobacter stygius]QCI64659.1 histidine kinase [Phreatobacter stygius]
MPTLMRFLTIMVVLGGLVFASMLAFAYLVDPEPRDMTVTIPANRLQPKR